MELFRLAALFWLALPANVLADDDSGCFTSFRAINAAMAEKPPFEPQTFSVCPNTVITIGRRDPNNPDNYINGDVPLSMRQWSSVYCGTEGSSSDNCKVIGGDKQVNIDLFSYNEEDKDRMQIKGFTFEDSNGSSSAIVAIYEDGELLIEDCVFQNHRTPGSVFRAPGKVGFDPQVTFNNCTFTSNALDGFEGIDPGMMTMTSVNLTITNSVFSNNDFVSEALRTTYLIDGKEGTVVNLRNNCFFGNNFQGQGIVNLASRSVVGAISNNFGGKYDEGLKCDFVHITSEDQCLDFDLQECPLEGVGAPPVKVSSSVEGKSSLLVGATVAAALVYFF